MDIVGGKEYVPFAKLFMIVGLIPIVLLYSKMVDKVRRYQLLCFFAFLYSLVGFFCAAVVAYYGLGTQNVSDSFLYWIFGWLYFFYVESFTAFVLSVFWAFLSSITTPDGAKKNYGTLISWSKIGGMMTSGIAWFLLAHNDGVFGFLLSDTHIHLLLMVLSAVLLLLVPVMILTMIKKVPSRYLHGYEAAYNFSCCCVLYYKNNKQNLVMRVKLVYGQDFCICCAIPMPLEFFVLCFSMKLLMRY